ncbi:hypothetical protein ACFL9U_01845 [Thermodesulfobacteriota bacterium]
MTATWEVFLESAEIFTLIFGFFGVVLSLLLIFSQDLIQAASGIFDRQINVDQKILSLNKYIQTNRFTYHYHVICSICLIVGSSFVLLFLFGKLDAVRFPNILHEIIFNSVVLLGKVVGFTGIILGFFLLIVPRKVQQVEEKMNAWYDTQPMIDGLNRYHRGVDTVFLRYPLFFGIAGMIASIFLIILSIVGILR